ncbi:lytic transglycosylase [Pseudomonas sp. GG8]
MAGPWEKYQSAALATAPAPDQTPAIVASPVGQTPPQAVASAPAPTQVTPDATPTGPWSKYQSPVAAPISAPAAPATQAAEPGLLKQVGNFFTGADRETRATNELPELQNSGLFKGTNITPAKAAQISATLLTTLDPQEAGKILSAASPDIGIQQDEKGNWLAANNKTGARAVINKPGLSGLDGMQLAAAAGLFAPAGGAAGLVGGGILKGAAAVGGATALTEAGSQAAQAAAGGTFDPADVALAGAGGVGGELVARGVGAIGNAVRNSTAAKQAQAGALRSDYDAAVASGENPATASARLAGQPEEANQQNIAQSIVTASDAKARDTDQALTNLANQADPNKEVLDAWDKLGIEGQLTPGQYSNNQAFREINQGLASVPGSVLNTEQNLVYQNLSDHADKLIGDFGGSVDKSAFSDDFRNQSLAAIKGLEKGSDDLYGRVGAAVPENTPAPADTALAHLNEKLANLNGDVSLLSAPEQRAYKLLSADPDQGKPLQAIAGLKVPARYADTANTLSDDANSLVTDFGGSLDNAKFSDQYTQHTKAAGEALEAESTALYSKVRAALPPDTEVPSDATYGFLQGRIKELGGSDKLTNLEKKLLMAVTPRRVSARIDPNSPEALSSLSNTTTRIKNSTYGRIDDLRKDIGSGLSKQGDFKDANQGLLKKLYAVVSDDQQRVVNAAGAGEDYTNARALIVQRKNLEDGLSENTGKGLGGSVAVKLGSAMKKLATGDFKDFDQTIGNIPDGMKQQALMTAIGDTFSGGKGRGLDIPALTSWYSNLSKNAAAKARLDQLLHPDAAQKLDSLAARSQGLLDTVTGKTPDGTLRTPSYKSLDQLRGSIESKLRTSPLADPENDQLARLHGALLSDQQKVADAHGVGDTFQEARALDAKRKLAHSNLTDLLGEDLKGAISNDLSSSVEQLKKGNFSKFDSVMEKIPEHLRGAAAATALNQAFSSGTKSTGKFSATGFSNFWESLSRNDASMKRFLSHFDPAARETLKNLATVSKGVSLAAEAKSKTGLVGTVLADASPERGMLGKLLDFGVKAGAAEGITTHLGLPGAGTAGVLFTMLSKQKIPAKEAATKMLASPEFQDMFRAVANAGGKAKANVVAREKQLMRTTVYQKWVSNLSAPTTARVAAVGPLAYLTQSAETPATTVKR